jgi:hypothetical protein
MAYYNFLFLFKEKQNIFLISIVSNFLGQTQKCSEGIKFIFLFILPMKTKEKSTLII